MAVDYKQLFNSVVNAQVEKKSKQEQLVEDVVANLIELEAILKEVIDSEKYEHTSVEYREDEKILCFECNDRCLEVVFNEESMIIDVRDKVISFNVDESTAGNNHVDVSYENEQSIYVIKYIEENIIYDFGADERDKTEGLFKYVVERAAEMVARG